VIADVRGRCAKCRVNLQPALSPPGAVVRRSRTPCHRAGLLVLSACTYLQNCSLLPALVIGEDLLEEGRMPRERVRGALNVAGSG